MRIVPTIEIRGNLMAYQTGRPEERPTERIDPSPTRGPYGGGYAPRQRPPEQQPPPAPPKPKVNAMRLWGGGVAAAVVAAGIGVVGLFIARGLFDVPVYLPQHDHTVFNADSVWLAVTGFCAGIVATAVMHALLLTAPRPKMFFGWIVALVTIVAALWPFSLDMPLYSQIATAAIAAVMGIAIGSMISGVASSSMMRPYVPGAPGAYPPGR